MKVKCLQPVDVESKRFIDWMEKGAVQLDQEPLTHGDTLYVKHMYIAGITV